MSHGSFPLLLTWYKGLSSNLFSHSKTGGIIEPSYKDLIRSGIGNHITSNDCYYYCCYYIAMILLLYSLGILWVSGEPPGSPLERGEGTLQMWLLRKEPSSSHTGIPSAPGSHLSVRKHLPSIACLHIQWNPQTHILPSLITMAKCCPFLERSAACSPALG